MPSWNTPPVTAQPSGTEPVRHGYLTGKAWRKRWAETHPEDERHGELTFYGYWGCRCETCRMAKRADRIHRLYPDAVISLYHDPTPYTVAEHRAFGEELCPACVRFTRTFSG